MEVEDCERLLVCDIPNLDASAAPLARLLNGKVLRPWCHFDLPESDYISGGRRNPEMTGPSGAVEPLDPATKVRVPGGLLRERTAAMIPKEGIQLVGNHPDHPKGNSNRKVSESSGLEMTVSGSCPPSNLPFPP